MIIVIRRDENEIEVDEDNEYDAYFGYGNDRDLSSENELLESYNEDEAVSALLDLYNADDLNLDLNYKVDDLNVMNSGNIENHPIDNKRNCYFLLPHYSPPKLELASFQLPNEPRIRYILRSIKLWQEFRNSGNLEKLHILVNDIFVKDCLLFMHNAMPPLVGPSQIFAQTISLNRNIPDLCMFFNSVVRSKRRLITFKGNSFGTIPYAKTDDRSTSTWNFFEHTPLDKLDEYHKLQKQKYDTLKSQNKVIKFERSCVWMVVLSRDAKYISKIMTMNLKVSVY